MFALGATQALLLRQNVLKQGSLMTIVGCAAAAAAYGVGYGLQNAVTGSHNGCAV